MRSKHSKERKNTEKENGKNILISLKDDINVFR